MEAILSGSSSSFKSSAVEAQYEIVSPAAEGHVYSYARVPARHQKQGRKDLRQLYDDPDQNIEHHIQAFMQSQLPDSSMLPSMNVDYETSIQHRREHSKSPLTIQVVPPSMPKHSTLSQASGTSPGDMNGDSHEDVDVSTCPEVYKVMQPSPP